MYNLDYYKSLSYRVIVEKDSFEGDTWYVAYSEELGKMACYGQGNTPEEAIKDYFDVKDDFIEMLFNLGEKIPEPDPNIDYGGCNGHIAFRTSPQTHALLLRTAKQQKCSLNLYLNNAVLSGFQNLQFGQIFNKLAVIETKLDKHHRYAETKKVSYDKGIGSVVTTIDPFAEVTQDYWLAKECNKQLEGVL
jgi:predicted RNase H-like HicB family nuclease